jgi:hypothetical protein
MGAVPVPVPVLVAGALETGALVARVLFTMP